MRGETFDEREPGGARARLFIPCFPRTDHITLIHNPSSEFKQFPSSHRPIVLFSRALRIVLGPPLADVYTDSHFGSGHTINLSMYRFRG
jgi:hypothetical protein